MTAQTDRRRLLLVLIFLMVVINYMARMNVLAAAEIREDLEISTKAMRFVETEKSFAIVLFNIGTAGLISFLCYVFLIGKVEEFKMDSA